LSFDGRRLAVRAGEAVHLYDTTDWHEIARLVHTSEPIDAAAFSPDGKRLATVSSHLGQLAVWNADNGALLRVTPSAPAKDDFQLAAGAGVAFSSDGRRVATALGTIVDVDTGVTVALPPGAVRGGRNYAIWFLAGDRIVAARTQYHSGDSWVGVVLEQFDARTGALLEGMGDDAVLSADQSTVAGRGSRSAQLIVERLNPDGSRASATFAPGAYAPFDHLVAVTAHGEALLAVVGSGIEAHDAAAPIRIVGRIELPPGMAFVAMSPADEVVTTGPCGTVAWSWRTGAAVWAQPFPVTQIAWAPGGALASAVGPGALWRAWRTDTGQALCTAPGGQAITRRVFSPDGFIVALTYDDGRIEVRDADLGNPHPLIVSGAAAAPGSQIVALSRGGVYAVMLTGDSTSGHALVVVDSIGRITGPPLRVDGASTPPAFVSADGRRLAYKDTYKIRMIDLASGAVLLADDGNDALLGFDPDDRRLAVLSADPAVRAVIRTYATADGAPADTFALPDDRVNFSALSPDWSFAVGWEQDAASFTYRMLRWPLAGGAPRSLTTGIPRGALAISTDGRLMFDRGIYYHEFTGDYMELNVTDAATGGAVQDFVDHDVSPSADGRRLFGQAGALFCR
jgi:hypothetical protein